MYFYDNPTVYYTGGWLKDEKSGEGKLVFPGGEYVGQWQNNVRQGQGRMKRVENGITSVYEGYWQGDELKEGDILYQDANGVELGRYRGQIHNGKKHGTGKYTNKMMSYTGNF